MRFGKEPLPRGKRRQVWDAVKAHLRKEGTVLERFVKTWQLAEGNDLDDVEPGDWTADLFPLFRLEIEGGPGQWQNEVTQKSPLNLTITLGLQGTDQGDALDFWEAVEQRLWPGDMSLYSVVKPLGVVAYTQTLPGIARRTFADVKGQLVTGKLFFNFEARTKY